SSRRRAAASSHAPGSCAAGAAAATTQDTRNETPRTRRRIQADVEKPVPHPAGRISPLRRRPRRPVPEPGREGARRTASVAPPGRGECGGVPAMTTQQTDDRPRYDTYEDAVAAMRRQERDYGITTGIMQLAGKWVLRYDLNRRFQ